MALKATIFKVELQVSDLDRGHFATHALTIARHPSETDERMMVRLIAFALNAGDRLEFGRGLSTEDEADLVQADLTGAIELWIDVGLPDERDIRKAAGRARQVKVYTYGRGAALWWSQNEATLSRLANAHVVEIPETAIQALARWVERTMRLECTIQEGQVWLSCGAETLHFEPVTLKAPA
ncbi:MAG TPA: YaeQ family protein [Usitatibacter sp.]|nr:YaeQ family protein [Usitatibacter sp.]